MILERRKFVVNKKHCVHNIQEKLKRLDKGGYAKKSDKLREDYKIYLEIKLNIIRQLKYINTKKMELKNAN